MKIQIEMEDEPFRTSVQFGSYYKVKVGPIPEGIDQLKPIRWEQDEDGNWFAIWSARRKPCKND